METITHISGHGVPVRGNEIDTDQIMPARFLKEITFDNMGEYVFYDLRFDEKGTEKKHPFNDLRYKGANIMIANNNFGCGSSREHAPQGIKRYGINAIIGESFAEIFAGNCQSLGILPITLGKGEIDMIQSEIEKNPETPIQINLEEKIVTVSNIPYGFKIPEDRRQAFLNGTWNALAILKANSDKVKETAGKLPYLNWAK